MSKVLTREAMHELGVRHATLEARCDLERTLATLAPDAEYAFYPLGKGFSGVVPIRRYYEALMGSFIPRTKGYRLMSEWVSETSVAQEYEIDLDIDGAVETHRVIGILFADASGERLGGERVYASERTVRLMTGDLFDDLVDL